MFDTPRLALPLLAAGQAQKHVTHNDALMRLDALVQLVVASRTQSVPPSVPTELSAYIVPAGGSGVFAGRADQLAMFEDGGWSFLTPRPGWLAWVEDEAEHDVWTSAEWRRASPVSALGAERWGVNATADATTRLTVSSAASLFNHAGADHRLTINKAGAAQTASLLFQNGFSGRAEIGLAGDDQLRLKVSPDGTAWTEALVVDRTSGAVSLPASPWAQAAARPNLLVNGDVQINQRGFAGGALAGGVYGFDRWKADGAGTSLSRSGFALTVSLGAIVQPVEPAFWGVGSFAGMPLTLSVEGLSGGALSVRIGSSEGTMSAGGGRRSVTLTPGAGDTGTLAVRLAPASGSVAFSRVKLELGSGATPFVARPASQELSLCRRYFCKLDGAVTLDAYQVAGAGYRQALVLPTPMRAAPTPSFTVSGEVNVASGNRGIDVVSAELVSLRVVAAATGRVSAQFGAIAFDAEM